MLSMRSGCTAQGGNLRRLFASGSKTLASALHIVPNAKEQKKLLRAVLDRIPKLAKPWLLATVLIVILMVLAGTQMWGVDDCRMVEENRQLVTGTVVSAAGQQNGARHFGLAEQFLVPCHSVRPARISSWEIHPVYSIFVCKNATLAACPPGAANWTPFHVWVNLPDDEDENHYIRKRSEVLPINELLYDSRLSSDSQALIALAEIRRVLETWSTADL